MALWGSADNLSYLASSRPMRDMSQKKKKKKLMVGLRNDSPSVSGLHMQVLTRAHDSCTDTVTARFGFGFLGFFLSVFF